MKRTKPQLTRRDFLKAALITSIVTPIMGTAGMAYGVSVEPDQLEVTHVELTLSRLPAPFDGYRIAQLSDIHMDGWMTRERLLETVRLVNEQAPDVVALTGDFVTTGIEYDADDLIVPFLALTPADGTFAVMGNHDWYAGAQDIRALLNESGVTELRNAAITIQRDDSALYVLGVDSYTKGTSRVDVALDGVPESGATVLLVHEPDYADVSAATGRIDLEISGHSHGGQVRLPFIGPLELPRYAHRYPLGLQKAGDLWVYTNRGIGVTGLPVRFNCRPEVTLLTLTMG